MKSQQVIVFGQDNFSSRRLWWKPNYIFTNLRILTIAVRPVHLRSQCEIFAKHWRFSGSCKWSPKVMVPSMVRYICGLWFLSPLGWLKETKPSKNQSGCTWRNVGQNSVIISYLDSQPVLMNSLSLQARFKICYLCTVCWFSQTFSAVILYGLCRCCLRGTRYRTFVSSCKVLHVSWKLHDTKPKIYSTNTFLTSLWFVYSFSFIIDRPLSFPRSSKRR